MRFLPKLPMTSLDRKPLRIFVHRTLSWHSQDVLLLQQQAFALKLAETGLLKVFLQVAPEPPQRFLSGSRLSPQNLRVLLKWRQEFRLLALMCQQHDLPLFGESLLLLQNAWLYLRAVYPKLCQNRLALLF